MKETKAFLKQIEKLDKIIENKMIERQQWKDMALGLSAGGESIRIDGVLHNMDKVQSSGNPQKMADAVAKYVDLERDIDRYIDRLIVAKMDVINVIEQLNPIEYDVLHKIYVQKCTFYDVADAYDKTYSWVTTIHGRALKSVKKILVERRKDAAQ